MLSHLYLIANPPTIVTVVAPGALAADESIPIAPITVALSSGYIFDFGSSKFAKLAAEAEVDDETLTVEPLPLDLEAGDEVEIPGSQASALLGGAGDKWAKLASDDLRLAMHLDAEMLLDLRAPAYTGADAEELSFAVVHQVLFMLEHGITPSLVKATSQGGPSAATKTYRDRWIDPQAAAIVARVTGRRAVRFEPFMAGV